MHVALDHRSARPSSGGRSSMALAAAAGAAEEGLAAGGVVEGPPTYEDEHEAFAASRWNDYVFVANDPKSLAALDKHVEAAADEVAMPLVVVGELGIGKSALLANWVQRRRARMHRDDFLFQHFVGSSPSSCQLATLLGRLAQALKAHYHLREMAVPESEERLRWSLARFLGAAAKKAWPAHLVIIIDGIDALRSDAASGDHGRVPSLHWLPTELPGNVRLVLAASAFVASPRAGGARRAIFDKEDEKGDGKEGPGGAVAGREQRLQQTLVPEEEEDEDEEGDGQQRSVSIGGTGSGGGRGNWGGRIVTELRRRGNPFLVMEPLTAVARGRIVDEFLQRCEAEQAASASGDGELHKTRECLTLTPEQRDRIIRAPATRRPLFLRMLLYALKLGVALSAHHSMTLDHQLDRYLATAAAADGGGGGGGGKQQQQDDASAKGLISEILDLSQQYVEGSGGGSPQVQGLLPRVLSAVYASRDGLSDEELRGLVELGMRQRLAVPLDAVVTVLNDMTILVKGLRSFSHEAFHRVVYDKYIRSPDALVRQHELLARYFHRLPTLSPRKLSCLAHHLEVAGLWHRLRDALVDIDHFPIWWAPPRRKEFVALWASLSNRRAAAHTAAPKGLADAPGASDDGGAGEQKGSVCGHGGRLVTGEFDEATMRAQQAPRPYFDVVDEFVRSVEGWRERRHPGDAELRRVVLDVAAFLLEFALQGHEATADVPTCYVHPPLPHEDLKALGVPYLAVDADGRAALVQPVLPAAQIDDGAGGLDLEGGGGRGASPSLQQAKPLQAELEGPAVTTYFFNRWMWTQFPLMALASCTAAAAASTTTTAASGDTALVAVGRVSSSSSLPTAASAAGQQERRQSPQRQQPSSPSRKALPASLVKIATLPLPQMVVRKPTRAREGLVGLAEEGLGVPGGGGVGLGDKEQVSGAMERMAAELYDDIQQYRREHDAIVQQRASHERRLLELGNELTDLQRTFDGTMTVHRQLEVLQEKQRRQSEQCAALRRHNVALKWVLLMCERHPPERPALVQELEDKIAQDARLLARLRERIWAERFEGQAYTVDHPKLRRAVHEALRLQHELLATRYRLRDNLATAAETNLRTMSRGLLHPASMPSPPHSPRSPRNPSALRRRTARSPSPGPDSRSSSNGGDSKAHASSCFPPVSTDTPVSADTSHKWARVLASVYGRTGIADLELFFQKLAHSDVLGEQMQGLSRAAEKRLTELKGRQQELERELYSIDEKTAAAAAAAAGKGEEDMDDQQLLQLQDAGAETGGEGTLALEQTMREAYLRYKQVREKAMAAMGAEQRARAGLQHVAEILGVLPVNGEGLLEQQAPSQLPQPSPPGAASALSMPLPLHEVVHQVEAVLDLLQDELERQQHQKLTGGVAAGAGGDGTGAGGGLLHKAASRSIQGATTTRPPELERALRTFETTKARIPHRLLRPPAGGRTSLLVDGADGAAGGLLLLAGGAADEGEGGGGGGGGGGVKSRRDLKAHSQRVLRIGQRKLPAAAPLAR